MQNNSFKALWAEERPWRVRLLFAALSSFAFVLTFVFFAPLDVFLHNPDQFPFLLGDVLGWQVFLSLGLFAAMALVLSLLRGKIFTLAVSLVFGLALAGYLQMNFFNPKLGELTGDAILWQDYMPTTLVNVLLWVAVVCMPLVVSYFSQKGWKRLVAFVCALIIGGQLSSVAVSLFGGQAEEQERKLSRYLSGEGLFDVSAKDNVLLFVVDRLDTRYVDDMLALEPDFLSALDGFTYYPNYTSMYSHTYPSIPQMLTGQLFGYDQKDSAYFKSAYKNGTFLRDLRKAGYGVRLFGERNYICGSATNVKGLADNVAEGSVTVNQRRALLSLLRLGMFRTMPMALKPSFWTDSATIRASAEKNRDPWEFTTDDFQLHQLLTEQKLTVKSEQSQFKYYHLYGCHAPITMNEKIQSVRLPDSKENIARQAMGCFNIIYEYIRQLKAQGLYENATIIICGDHGKVIDNSEVREPSATAFFLKPKGSAGAPMQVLGTPGSHEQFQATVLKAAGLSTKGYGESLLETPEDAQRTRTFFHELWYRTGDKAVLEYRIEGDAREMESWKLVREFPVAEE